MTDMAEAVRRARADAREREEEAAPVARMRVTTLADLRSGSVPATMIVRGMPINIEYDPDGVTLESLQRASALQDGDGKADDLAVMTDFLINTILRWDLREEDGETIVDLSAERLAKFGIGLLADMSTALIKATRMGEASGTPSRQRLSRTRTKGTRSSLRR
jgi:hypothetical protein